MGARAILAALLVGASGYVIYGVVGLAFDDHGSLIHAVVFLAFIVLFGLTLKLIFWAVLSVLPRLFPGRYQKGERGIV
ncbi:hypothetical protein [Branchiibius sp. NY16-3462-2]|uniref:hypothetical protein n=1 Tax=Branchiibius sp. NY16-3462-2 TaxID=1807500 RepID=UPI0007915221|nr:hypothetical protein [Branchiibius sp. NY16-3462-2]KYH43457.1 hypothetical protein AZH51_17045 [Branchiibius sp. NY16-3462-2]